MARSARAVARARSVASSSGARRSAVSKASAASGQRSSRCRIVPWLASAGVRSGTSRAASRYASSASSSFPASVDRWPRRSASRYCSKSGPLTTASLPRRSRQRPPPGVLGLLALGVLRRLAGALEAVLLALLHPRVAGEQARLAQLQAMGLRIELEQRPGDAVADCAGLAADPAALDLDHGVVAAVGVGDAERQLDVRLVDRGAEVLDQRPTVDHDLALAGQEPHARDGGLATAGAGVEGLGSHVLLRQASGSGRWA